MSNSNENNFLNINGEFVELSIYLINQNITTAVPIDIFISFSVEEDINSPFYKGVLTVRNDSNTFDLGENDLGQNNKTLNYDLDEASTNIININLDFQYKKLSYYFSITEENNEIVNNIKVKNFILEDSLYYFLNNSKIPYSTSSLLKGDTTQLSDKERSVNISDAIKHVINDTFKDRDIIDLKNWAKSTNNINYSSCFDDTRLNVLDYILDKALDNQNNFLYLFKRDNKFKLLSIEELCKNYFKNNYNNNFGGSFNISNSKQIRNRPNVAIGIPVTDYSIYNENPNNTLKDLINYKVINYNFNNKKFNLFSTDNTIDNLSKHINENFLSQKTKIERNVTPVIKKHVFYNQLYTTNPDEVSTRFEGRNTLLKNLINLSTMLAIECKGANNINTGNFINVNYPIEDHNKKAKKLNGGWFVIGYKHTFTKDNFTSEIACTKFHELI